MSEPQSQPADAAGARNRVLCPRCGEVKLETPPGTLVLPTLGMARKAAGARQTHPAARPPARGSGPVARKRQA